MQPPFAMLVESDIERFRRDTFWTKEPETLAWIDTFADGSIFFDVGANVGVYSLYCAAVHPRCRIYAFEPDAMNYGHLRKNIVQNAFPQIAPLHAAVSDVFGLLPFRAPRAVVGATGGQIDNDECDQGAGDRVTCWTLDKFTQAWTMPHHIKIDIDGQELRVVRGMEATLRNPRLRSVLIEVDGDPMSAARMEILGMFSAAGFTTDNRFNAMNPHSRERRKSENIPVENIVFTR